MVYPIINKFKWLSTDSECELFVCMYVWETEREREPLQPLQLKNMGREEECAGLSLETRVNTNNEWHADAGKELAEQHTQMNINTNKPVSKAS